MRRLGYAGVEAICVRDAAKGERLCEFFGIPRNYVDYRDMLVDPEIDVVHNCTPNPAHFAINRDVILAGRHLLSEKPLAIASEESAALLDLLKTRKVRTAVNFVYRHHSMVRYLKRMIEGGELGEIYSIRGSYLQDWLLFGTDYNWRVESTLGGPSRAMADIGSHWCDLAQFLVGQRITEVCADLATFVPVRMDASSGSGGSRRVDVDTEDYSGVLIGFEKGARGSFTVSQVSAGRKLGLTIEIDGSAASARWEQESADRLWIGHREKPNEELIAHPDLLGGKGVERWPEAQKNMIDSFYRTILYGEPPVFADFAQGHSIILIVEAALESSRDRRWKKVRGATRLEPPRNE